NQEDDDKNDDEEETDSDRIESDRIKIPVLNQSNTEYYKEEEEKVNDEEKLDEEEDDEVTKELYKDVNVNLGNEDAKMTNAESGFEQEEEDAHVTLTAVHDAQKTEGLMQSSSVSSDFIEKLLNFENVSPADNEIASLIDTTVRHEETSSQTSTLVTVPITEYINLVDTSVRTIIREEVKTQLPQILPKAVSDFATLVIEQNVTESLEAVVLAKSFSQPKSTYEAAASLLEYELTKILLDKMEESKSHLRADYKRELYDALVKSYNTDKDLFDTYGEVFTLKRSRYEKDKDQDPFAGSDRGTKRRKSSKEAETPKELRSKEEKSSSSSNDTSRTHHKSSGANITARAAKPPTSFDELMDTPIDFSAFVMNRLNITNLTQELLVEPAFNLLKGTCNSLTKLEYHFEECSKATTERLDWHNPEGKPYSFDLRKPLPLILDHRDRQVIPKDDFINNDLEYLKGGSLSRQYLTSITKTKAATYEIKWIEDMVSNLWSPVKVLYTNMPTGVLYTRVSNVNDSMNLQATGSQRRMFTLENESLQLPDLRL
ncbi:hypothetical protein Tco_1013592, partial [Tanacetum coccineum]